MDLAAYIAQLPETPFVRALAELCAHEAQRLANVRPLPIPVYIAGGAAVHLWTRQRSTSDVDAEFGRRIVADDFRQQFVDADGKRRVLYFDRQFNPHFSLLHEDYQQDAIALGPQFGEGVLAVYVLAPIDLVLSKLARFADVDREDIARLQRAGLIAATALRARVEEALVAAIGVDAGLMRARLDEVLA